MNDLPYIKNLNPAQKEAVLHTEGALLVLAGAGSGKTRVITHRIVHLVHQGIAPHNILAVTFTNKAAREMQERVNDLIKKFPPSERAAVDSQPLVSTFHSLGVRIIRQYHQHLNLPRHFTIFDRTDSLRAIKSALEKGGFNPKEFEPRKMLSKISRAKGDAETVQSFADTADSFPDQVTAKVWGFYDEILKTEGALDFDDLLNKTLFLIKNNPPIQTDLQNKFKYIHIDEYQDTNAVQFSLAKLLTTSATTNICAVGDIDQNIYSWRGADIKNILQFEREFANSATILLEENYRSTQTIIAASNEIIEKNHNRVPKAVFTSNEEGEKITLYAAMNAQDEADFIANQCQELIKEGTNPADIAILYRTNFQSRILEESFLKHNLPYQLLGTKFYDRKEIKDVLSYLRFALNPQSVVDLTRIINEPARGIGKVTLLKVVEGRKEELKGAMLEKVERFYQIISDIKDEALTKPLSETIKFIIKRTGIETELKKNGTEDDLSRLENLQELVTLSQKFDELPSEEAIEKLLETASLQSDQDELKDKKELDAIRLMTVHAAKGLEFNNVFICGLEEGLFPHERLDETGIDHEEERRLFYVALTRAGKKLFLTYAHIRTIYGSQKINVPSSFINDINTEHIENANQSDEVSFSGYESTIFFD